MAERTPKGYKCLNCGKVHYPKHGRCLECKHQDFQEVELPSIGSLVTYTILKAPPSGIQKSSLLLGIVDLGEVRYTGQLDIDTDDIELGMKLRAVWKPVREIDGKMKSGFVWEPL
ncbi:MAG: OB-fold domain-containing protein [Candidatus Heimdallarchaeota archaeon]|nr:MAG: OB-fold domain-containing protein [Candidatus Heimdallarchaeota archaeon]